MTHQKPSFIRGRTFRILAYTLFAAGSLTLTFFFLFGIVLPILAWCLPQYESLFYEAGAFGIYRNAQYVTLPFNVTVPKGRWAAWDQSCDDGGLIMLAPFGPAVDRPGPIIFDSRGELVWVPENRFFDTTTNVNVQTYNGTPYLTFWAGEKRGTAGSGVAYMLDSKYRIFREIKAVGEELRTDLHDFSITHDGNALITTINYTTSDLRPLGWFRSEHGPIENSIAQEIGIETGELIWQWSALDHYTAADSYWWDPLGGYDLLGTSTFDFCHLNSAQKDHKGNYLLSSRHLHKLLYVDGRTGETIWYMGGKKEEGITELQDLSDGNASDFLWQHHARWDSDQNGILTLFDNGAAVHSYHEKPVSHALMLRVDHSNSTVELLNAYTANLSSRSQGSAQVLPNGRLFAGWGSVPATSEHEAGGKLLCEFHFAATWWTQLERVKNYRAFKVYDWYAEPEWPPIATRKDGRVWVSWNGATEVRFWRLQGARRSVDERKEAEWEDLEMVEKEGFESSFLIPRDGTYASLRVAGLDGEKKVLRYSQVAEEAEEDGGSPGSGVVLGTLFAGGFAIGGGFLLCILRARRVGRRKNPGSWELMDWRRYKYSKLED